MNLDGHHTSILLNQLSKNSGMSPSDTAHINKAMRLSASSSCHGEGHHETNEPPTTCYNMEDDQDICNTEIVSLMKLSQNEQTRTIHGDEFIIPPPRIHRLATENAIESIFGNVQTNVEAISKP